MTTTKPPSGCCESCRGSHTFRDDDGLFATIIRCQNVSCPNCHGRGVEPDPDEVLLGEDGPNEQDVGVKLYGTRNPDGTVTVTRRLVEPAPQQEAGLDELIIAVTRSGGSVNKEILGRLKSALAQRERSARDEGYADGVWDAENNPGWADQEYQRLKALNPK